MIFLNQFDAGNPMNAERASGVSDPTEVEIRKILVQLARAKGLITYSELVKRIGAGQIRWSLNLLSAETRLRSVF